MVQIVITLPDGSITRLDIDRDSLVGEIKQRLAEEFGLGDADTRLFVGKVDTQDEFPLSVYGVEKDSVVRLVLRKCLQ